MRYRTCFIIGAILTAYLFGLNTTLWGQEPNDVNDVAELKIIIAKLEKQIEEQEKKIKRLREELQTEKEELQAEQKENKRLTKICREAGINVEKTESPTQADYEVCTTPIEPNVLSDSMKTLGFTDLKVGELGWIDRLIIQQIIDANNAIVRVMLERGEPITPNQIDFLYKTVWLKGVQTNRFADDTSQVINHYFVITGTKTYRTAMGGQKTIYVIEPVILSPKRLKQETMRYEDLKKQWSRGVYGLKGSQKPAKTEK
jgi:hypothetical protein